MNKGDCEEGAWKQLDAPKNRFTAGWRPQALNTWIEELPTSFTADNNQTYWL